MIKDNIYIEAFVFSPYAVNTYIVGDNKEVMIIDMPATKDDLMLIDKSIGGRTLSRIVYTHGHFDHIQGSDDARTHYKNTPQYIHEKDNIMFTDANENLTGYFGAPITYHSADFMFKESGETFNIGSIKFEVMHTPGHSNGSVCYYTDGHLFTGDTLFYMGVGRTDFPHGDSNTIKNSIEKIFELPDETLFYPGHEKYGAMLGKRKSLGIII